MTQLQLRQMASSFAEVAVRAAREGLTHEAFLYELVRQECAARDARRVARLRQAVGLPAEKTFTTLHRAAFSPLIVQQLERLRSGQFVRDAVSVLALGRPGVGKIRPTHCPDWYGCSAFGTD